MKIHHIHISNFRRLNDCHIDFDEKQTILIGANNSGKTSAITALIWFMQQKKQLFSTREFTLFNWEAINENRCYKIRISERYGTWCNYTPVYWST